MIHLSLIDKLQYRKLLNYFFESCTEFMVMYPYFDVNNFVEYDNPLLNKGLDFLKLPDIKFSSWSGMKDGICISGKLTSSVKDIFFSSLEDINGVWCYCLIRCGELVFEVNDFNVALINVSSFEFDFMVTNGIIDSNFIY